MKLIQSGSYSRDLENGSCAALGFFDGVHLGHKNVIERCVSEANRKKLASVVWTLSQDGFSDLITNDEEKLSLIKNLGIDYIAVCDFEEIKNLSGKEFVSDVLCRLLNCKSAFCGYNFTFGKGKSCNATSLASLMKEKGGEAIVVPCYEYDSNEVSSSNIRYYLKKGDIKQAELLLGHSYFISGEVIHGNEIGRKIGFPTLNISVEKYRVRLPYGVYKVSVISGENVYRGIADYGIKPTVNDDWDSVVLETHLLNNIGTFYGKNITVEFGEFIRPERKFASVEQLTEQIKKDVEKALAD